MEGEPKFEEEERSSIYDVVGGTEEEQNSVLDDHVYEMQTDTGKYFEVKEKLYQVKDFEKEKTEEEIKMVKIVLERLDNFMKDMGDPNPLKIRPEQVHFLYPDKIKAANLPLINFFDRRRQFIGICDLGNSLENMQGLAHETIHAHSFQSLEIDKDKSVSDRRFGIRTKIRGGQNYYFEEINEAITEELTIIFDRNYLVSVPGLEKELELRQKFIDAHLQSNDPEIRESADEIAYIKVNNQKQQLEATGYSYPAARERFGSLVKEVFKANETLFKSEDEVFMLFVQAAMGGRMLDLARVVEKTYGKGSFRKLGKVTAGK